MKIGIDIDGVIYPWTRSVNQAVMREFGVPDPGEHQYWNYLKDQITEEQWAWVWSEDGAEPVFNSGLVFPQTIDFVQELIDNHEVHFVTHRNPERTAGITGRYLASLFSGYAGVHVLHNAVPKSFLEWDLFIDDKPEVCVELVKNTDAQVFMPDRDYNRGRNDPHVQLEACRARGTLCTCNWDRITRFTSWKEVTSWVHVQTLVPA